METAEGLASLPPSYDVTPVQALDASNDMAHTWSACPAPPV